MNDVNRMNRKVLEELKAMGRMDGDVATDEVYPDTTKELLRREIVRLRKENEQLKSMPVTSANEARTIEGWRQECERLRQEIEQLRIAGGQLQDERDKAEAERRHWYGISQKLLVTNNQLREQSESGAEAVSAGMIREIEALHIIIKHMAPLL